MRYIDFGYLDLPYEEYLMLMDMVCQILILYKEMGGVVQ